MQCVRASQGQLQAHSHKDLPMEGVYKNHQNQVSTQQTIDAQGNPISPQEMQSSRENASQMLNNQVEMQKHATPNIPSTLENSSRTTARQEQESGLDQLSRMVHESLLTETDDSSDLGNLKGSTSTLSESVEQQAQSKTDHMHNYEVNTYTQ